MITSYINVDSSKRSKESLNTFGEELLTLPPYALYFTNGSSIVSVEAPKHNLKKDDMIILDNIISKNVILQNVVSFKKNSYFVRINHPNHGLSLHGLYNNSDPNEFIKIDYAGELPDSFNINSNIGDATDFYILKKNSTMNMVVQLSNIKGINNTRTRIGNVPTNFLNKKHTAHLIFSKNGHIFEPDPNSYIIMLEKKADTNYKDGSNFLLDNNISNNTVHIKFNNLFGIPLCYLNYVASNNENRKFPYFTILGTTSNTFTVDVGYNAIIDPGRSFYGYEDIMDAEINSNEIINSNRGGGNQVFARKVISVTPGYPEPNLYSYDLERNYSDVVVARIVGSIFPNSQKVINNTGNRLYWRNLDDGDYIYYLEIVSGNYSPENLQEVIKNAFSKTIRYGYSKEYAFGLKPPSSDVRVAPSSLAGVIQNLVGMLTPTNNYLYDENGYYKYHIVDVSISSETDIVSFSAFKEIIQYDGIDPVIVIPDIEIEIIMSENISRCGNHIPFMFIPGLAFKPFDPDNEIMFIYPTENSHDSLDNYLPNIYHNLYIYTNILPNMPDYPPQQFAFRAVMDTDIALLVNFTRPKGNLENSFIQEINSINTLTILDNFTFNYLINEVHKFNHSLKVGDILLTDKFIDPGTMNQLFVYEITKIIDGNRFIVTKYRHREKYKFIYDNMIINFNTDENPMHSIFLLNQNRVPMMVPRTGLAQAWNDPSRSFQPVVPPCGANGASENRRFFGTPVPEESLQIPLEIDPGMLSIIDIIPTSQRKNIMWIKHPNHMLSIGDTVTISLSQSINHVPNYVINGEHIINKIIDPNYYEIILGAYTSVCDESNSHYGLRTAGSNTVLIRFPDIFQMFFNYPDTIGNLLSFRNVGEENSITNYMHTIKNTTTYIGDSHTTTIPNSVRKLDMTGPNYFYISCPELANYHNTKPVPNVFAIIRWFDEPGNIVFDSYEQSTKIFNPPLKSLSRLHFAMHNPDGKLVEFNGLDHQFTIEITEFREQLDGQKFS